MSTWLVRFQVLAKPEAFESVCGSDLRSFLVGQTWGFWKCLRLRPQVYPDHWSANPEIFESVSGLDLRSILIGQPWGFWKCLRLRPQIFPDRPNLRFLKVSQAQTSVLSWSANPEVFESVSGLDLRSFLIGQTWSFWKCLNLRPRVSPDRPTLRFFKLSQA